MTHKYGIEVPTLVAHALEIDKRNKNHKWRDAIDKEMSNITVAFDILPPGKLPHPGYTKASGHFVLDVKMDLLYSKGTLGERRA